MITPEETAFLAVRPELVAIYEVLKQGMISALPPFSWRVQKTQITFVHPRVFACVSHKWKDGLVLSLGLARGMVSSRIHQSAEIRPGRWTHHIIVKSEEEVDEELLEWLKEAYDFAARP